MSAKGNGQFREDELVSRRTKVDGEWQTRTFPVVGGRLRLAHEGEVDCFHPGLGAALHHQPHRHNARSDSRGRMGR